MPQFVLTSPWNRLSYRWKPISLRSATLRADWLRRCTISTLLVCGLLIAFETLLAQRFDHAGALPLSLLVLLLMPPPPVRLPLMFVRTATGMSALAGVDRAYRWAASSFPAAVRPWESLYGLMAAALMIGMWIWVVMALRAPRRHTAITAVAPSGADQKQETVWSNVPAIRLKNVGGAAGAKEQLNAIARNRFARTKSGIVQNGVLFYGPQGTGKNLLAEAVAGEYRANFYHVRCPELVGQNTGSGAERIRSAFEAAAANRPIVLFLDEVDSIGSRKQVQGAGTDAGGGGREYNSLVTQLMQSIDQYRSLDGFLIVAATNYLDGLEPTLTRDGRFDAKIRLDLPNEAERVQILTALLAPHRSRVNDLSAIARRTPSWSPARLKGLVDRAALAAAGRAIADQHLVESLENTGGRDQAQLEPVGWDDVILPETVMADLRTLLNLMRPGRAEELSLPTPTGLLLVGPPGTGKTLVARLIASQAKRSFYSVSPSDVLGGAVGASVKRLTETFQRAKDNAPSIIFFDEIDGLFPLSHGQLSQHDVQLVEQGLIEISSLKPEHQVFLIGTTNYLDRIDARLLRGGRFSEKVEIPVPDEAGYQKLIARHLGKASLARDVSLEALAAKAAGMAPADLEATIQAMKRIAMRRMAPDAKELPPLTLADFDDAVGRVQPRF